MTSLMSRALIGASALALAALAAAPAAAQTIDRIVAFGDSYAETAIYGSSLVSRHPLPFRPGASRAARTISTRLGLSSMCRSTISPSAGR